MNRKIISGLAKWYTKRLIPAAKISHRERNWSKSEDTEKMSNYSYTMANYVADVADECRSEVKQYLVAYMEEKKQEFSGAVYLEQLEKNYVYLDRCVAAIVNHANRFLLGWEEAPRTNNLESVIDAIRLTTQEESATHISYLKSGCHGCKYHENHALFSELRELRLRDLRAYLDEIEFGCRFYKAKSMLSQVCLASLWQESDDAFAGIFDWDKEKMDFILSEYLKFATNSILSDLPFRDTEGKLLNIIVLER